MAKKKATSSREETLANRLLDLKAQTEWSWEKMCREFHRVMEEEGPSHTTLHRYATGAVKRKNTLTERYVREAIHRIVLELMQKELRTSETHRERLEKELRRTELRFYRLVESAKDIIFRYRIGTPAVTEYISPAVSDILGYTPEEFYADPDLILRIAHPESRSRLQAYLRGEEVETRAVLRFTHRDGRLVWIERVAVAIRDEKGNLVAMEGIGRDVTEQKETEEKLRAAEKQFRNLVEHTNDILWEVDQDGVYTYVSPNVSDILGYRPEQLLGKTPFEFMPAEEARRVGEIFGQVVREKKTFTSLQHEAVCRNGTLTLLECSGTPILGSDGTLRGYRGIDRDIRNRYQ